MDFPRESENTSSRPQFNSCEEAFSYVLKEKAEEIKRRVTEPACYGKNQEISREYFYRGEVLRRNARQHEAIEHFRVALRVAFFGTDLYIQILCHLSATYYMLNEFTLSHRYLITFVELLDTDLKEKILTNLEHVYFKFLNNEEIEEIWREILRATNSNDARIAVRALQDAYMNTDIVFKLFEENKLIETKIEKNDKFLNVIPKAALMYNKERGRHVVAKELISQGEVILYESPYVSHTATKYVCGNCNNSIGFFIPCLFCSFRVYCSHSCHEEHKFVHIWECKVYQFLRPTDLTACAHLGFQAFLKGLARNEYQYSLPTVEQQLQKFGDARNNFPYVRSMNSYFEMYCKNHDLIGTIGYNCAVIALYLCNRTDFVKWINSHNGFQNLNDAELFLKVGTEIMRLSFLSECDLLDNMNIGNKYLRNTGFYPALSMFNHSCMPNTSKYYNGNYIVLTANKSIKPGEEICSDYGFDFLTPLKIRQMILKRVYDFDCRCNGCTIAKYLNANISTFFCINCTNFRMVLSSASIASCTSCPGHAVLNPNMLHILKIIEASMKQLRIQFSLLLANTIQQIKLQCKLRLPYKLEIEFIYLLADYYLKQGHYKHFIKLLMQFHSLHYPCRFIFAYYSKFIELYQCMLQQIMEGEFEFYVCTREAIDFALMFLEDYEVYLHLYHPLISKLKQVQMIHSVIKCYKKFISNDVVFERKQFKIRKCQF